ncbi:DUF2169 family type VI secretion system accessory protein [Acinetobacter shaoyimingii]|uniref:DUF2169 domain-containing protein n=1 Tax=Acinetobacter shaoyimingii TaxID=2715164 RepID=A0A6G8RVD3_9GAMM|nr:DUF2169 domain-containing protein [Acinetobacter shaoyimingii]QIO05899.1 DUF2169 domain-containing protein [Acinetobacter shaoyimingii]
MNLENQTPFPALMYSAADPDRQEHDIVVMKVSYKILRHDENSWGLELISDGSVPLCLADEFWGEMGQSSVKVESDLAPYKPMCDVILNGTAYTPNAKEMTAIAVRLKLSHPEKPEQIPEPQKPQPLNPTMPLTDEQVERWQHEKLRHQQAMANQKIKYKTQLEKTLSILGESVFKPNALLPGWKRTSLSTFTELPIRWEYAFGGTNTIYKYADDTAEPLYNQTCFTNPIGTGWIENDYFSECEKVNAKYRTRHEKIEDYKMIKAPRIEYHLQRQPKPAFVKHPKRGDLNAKQMAQISQNYPYQPAGFGYLGRPWSPRIALAGTYDEKWLEEQHPYPPQDIDYGYWNAAPTDQQIEFFYPNARLELWNLTKPEFSHKGYVCIDFPGHRPYITMHFKTGEVVPFPMITDTVLIDTDNMIISLTHKAWIRADTAPLHHVETRFSDEAEGALFIFPEEQQDKKDQDLEHLDHQNKERRHG